MPVPTITVEVEDALGPGLEIEVDAASHRPTARRYRPGGVWLGFDRATLVASDDGAGTALAVLVALPISSFRGCRMEVELVAALEDRGRVVLVAALPGTRVPPEPLVRAAAGLAPDAVLLPAAEAGRLAVAARRVYRERAGRARIVGGLAWRRPEGLPPEAARWNTPHSAAEYRLDRLPPRFVRGLEGLLDDDERLLYAVERPGDTDAGLLDRLRRPGERRAALLLLTDRQLLWLVDHADPGRYLMDWGVDAELIPVERLTGPVEDPEPGTVGWSTDANAATAAGPAAAAGASRTVRLAPELAAEARVMQAFIGRFAARPALHPVRRYPVVPLAPDPELAGRFGQADEAASVSRRLEERIGPLDAFLYSPRRQGQRQPAALGLGRESLALIRGRIVDTVAIGSLGAIKLAMSPLVGRIALRTPGRELTLTYPAPLGAVAAHLVRLTRRAWANGLAGPRDAA